ncbi:MAG: hypothetical protein A2539_00755 [Elusimicrobia bacterium RIFOXYD2_FULL_34_15]|nr:MAG: hypothetical protein A2539_00755 [Elusimicrobia bacterium RIFOXYD2_FULL_34_15]HAM38452.1 hypothetical protein [Elusimicrobiota bacterium]
MEKYIQQIRDLINEPRKRYHLLKNVGLWHQLCSSMDVIEDTDSAIQFYKMQKFPKVVGGGYLMVCGVLQALFLQQDAVKHLCESLELYYNITNEELKNVREIRNDSIGHPTKRDGGKSYHFISRITISKDGFQLMSWNKNKNIVFKDIVIVDLLNAQSRNITVILKDVIKKLKDEDKKHKEKFCMDKLKDVFSQVHYDIQKVHEGLSKPKYIPISKISLQMINECLTKFENKLNERGISLDTYDSIKDIYVLLKYPLFELSRFFLKTKKNIKMNIDKETAFIFWYFVREHIEKLEELAKEIDEEYIK